MGEQPGKDLICLTNVHEDERVLGNMVALICHVFRCDMWDANRKNGSEAEDLIMVEVDTEQLSMEKIRHTSMTNTFTYAKWLKSSITGK
jgi:hypothetical protein